LVESGTKNHVKFGSQTTGPSKRGYVVLRYYKRGIGTNHTLDTNVWGNVTLKDLKEHANTALRMLMQQPEVDNTKITVLGISTFALQSCLY
jgi:hypothetical protein